MWLPTSSHHGESNGEAPFAAGSIRLHLVYQTSGGHVSLDAFLLANSAETAAGQKSGISRCPWVAARAMAIMKQ